MTLQVHDSWFWAPQRKVHNLTTLAGFYHGSVGANGHLEIDFAVDRTGNVAPAHVAACAWAGATAAPPPATAGRTPAPPRAPAQRHATPGT